MRILTANSANKKQTAKVTEGLQTLVFTATVTGDFSAQDRVAKFHEHIGQVTLTVTRRVNGKTRDIVVSRPLNELLEQMAQYSDDVITIVMNGTADMTIVGRLNIGGIASILGNNFTYPEITVDLGAETDTTVVVDGERNHVIRDGNLFYDTMTTLANQDYEFATEQNMVHLAVPDTITRLLIKHSTNVDVEFTFAELKNKFINANGLTYIDNGVPKFATKWIVVPFIPSDRAVDMAGYTTGVKIKTSNSATFYVLKKF